MTEDIHIEFDRKVIVTYKTKVDLVRVQVVDYVMRTDFDADAISCWSLGEYNQWMTLALNIEQESVEVIQDDTIDPDEYEYLGQIRFSDFRFGA